MIRYKAKNKSLPNLSWLLYYGATIIAQMSINRTKASNKNEYSLVLNANIISPINTNHNNVSAIIIMLLSLDIVCIL